MQLQRSGSTNTMSPAHTSTRVKTLTPFCPRSRRGDDLPKSVSPNPLSAGRQSEEHHGSAPDVASPYLGMTDAQIVAAVIKKVGADVGTKQPSSAKQERSSTPATLTITTQNSADLNSQLSELAKDMSPTAHGQRLTSDSPSQASSMPTLTVQSTSTRATPVVQQTTTADNVVPSDGAGGLLNISQPLTPMGSDSRHRGTDTLPERVSPRPRATIFADIRERVFGNRPPSTSLQTLQQQPEQQQQQQLQPAQSFSKLNVEDAKADKTSSNTTLKSAPLAVAEDDFLDTDQVTSTSPESREAQPSDKNVSVSPPGPQTASGKAGADISVGQPASSQLPAVAVGRDDASEERQFQTAASVTATQTAASTISSAVDQALSRDQMLASQTMAKTDEPLSLQQQQQQKQQRVVAKAEVSPFRMADWPGTHYGIQQVQKPSDAYAEGSAVTAAKQKTPATQDRIEMSVPSPTIRTDGIIASNTASAQQPTTVRLQKTPTMMPQAALTSSASVDDASLMWRTAATQGGAAVSRSAPSPVSRVDWAKQRFGATQSLDSSGFSVGPEIQQTRMTGELSPKLPPRHLTVMPSVAETASSRMSSDEVPSSPGANRRQLAVNGASGQRSVLSTSPSISAVSKSQLSTTAALSTSSATGLPAASLISTAGNGSSKIAIVHGQQVTSGTAVYQQQPIVTSRAAAPAAGPQPSVLVTSSSDVTPIQSYSQNAASSSAAVARPTSGQLPMSSHTTPIINTSLSSTSTQAISITRPSQSSMPVQPVAKTATAVTSGGSCFAMRLPDPGHLQSSSSSVSSSSQKSATAPDVDQKRPGEIHSMSAVSRQQPVPPPAQTSITSSSFLTNNSGPTQSPTQTVRFQGSGVSLGHGQTQQVPGTEITATLPFASSSLRREPVSSSPKSTHQSFQFPVPSETGRSADSGSNPPTPLMSGPRQTFVATPASATASIRSDGTTAGSSRITSATVATSPLTVTKVDVQVPSVDQIVARPALPTVQAFISKPAVPEVHLTAVALRPAIVIESAVPESKLVPVTMSVPSQPSTRTPAGIQQVSSLQQAAAVEKQIERDSQSSTSRDASSSFIKPVAQTSNAVNKQTTTAESGRATETADVSSLTRREVLRQRVLGIVDQSTIQNRVPTQQQTSPGVAAVSPTVTPSSAAATVTPSQQKSTITPPSSSAVASTSGTNVSGKFDNFIK
jgi:hypothetical protein